jgi:transposase-like protein
MQGKDSVLRKRRRHSEEFRKSVVAASRQPGVSVSAVALANGLNANLLRRWIKESGERVPVRRPSAVNPVVAPMTLVPVAVESGESVEEIRIDIRRAGMAVQLAWPAGRLAELSGLLKELLR